MCYWCRTASMKGTMPLPSGVQLWIKRMKPVLCFPFIGMTLMVGWQEAHPAHKKLHSTNPKRFSSGTGGGGPKWEPADSHSPGKWPLTGSNSRVLRHVLIYCIVVFLWTGCVNEQNVIIVIICFHNKLFIMAALRSRCGHYIFAL